MEKIKVIAEQTEFLLGKQKEVLGFFQEQYDSLKTLLESELEEAEKTKAGPELTSFQNVATMLSQQQDELVAQFEEDISFLQEQYNAIQQIMAVEDEQKRAELTDMLVDKDHKILETEQFKTDVTGEAEESKKNFSLMIEDIKATLVEDGVKELEALLEAHMNEQASGEESECSTDECSAEECSACEGCEGVNIFEGLEEESGEEN
jgi:hypothetical protein